MLIFQEVHPKAVTDSQLAVNNLNFSMKQISMLFLPLCLCCVDAEDENIDSIRLDSLSTIKNHEAQGIEPVQINDLLDSNSYYLYNSCQTTLLSFSGGNVVFEFLVQCHYTFPLQSTDGDSLVVIWEINEDCVTDVGIESCYGINERPEVGQPFASIIQSKKDNSLFIRYFYKEWVDKFNQNNKILSDSLFPSKFYPIEL